MHKRWIGAGLAHRWPNGVFWLTFLALNALLFLPLYLFNAENMSLLPPAALLANGWWLGVNQLLLWRENLDPLRLSLELTVLVALWVNVRWLQRGWLRITIVLLYLLALAYYLYEAIVVSIYRADPVFYSQYYLARDGLPFLARHAGASIWLYVGALASGVLAVLLINWLVRVMLRSSTTAKSLMATRSIMAGLAVLGLIAGVRYQIWTAAPEMVVSGLSFKLHKNIAESRQLYRDITGFDDTTVRRTYDYTGYRLQRQPDLYFLFIESYGSVLYKRADFRRAYTALLTELDDQLHTAGWQTTSALSDSPTWGGGSWMAYTSLLFGLRIDNHPHYLSLLNKYQLEEYPDLGRYLRSQGYYYAWVSSIAKELDDGMWNKYIRFLGVDTWLRHGDLDYHGPQYGWGPAPPDQYVLNYAQDLLQRRTEQPLLFFTITQNSHYPWTPQPDLVTEWQTLNQTLPAGTAPAAATKPGDKRQNYQQAIEYQLRMLVDFILRTGDENSLFILIGDHQPPQVSRRADGWATPLHIISRDGALLAAFEDYGFAPGLEVKTLEPALRHEGFYSLFLRVLLSQYGADQTQLPAYLPEGVIVTQVAQDAPVATNH
jgi:hypothetical protein